MVTKQELDAALGNAETGKRLRLVFYDAGAENAPLALRSVLMLNTAGVINFEKWTSAIAILFAARDGVWDRGNRTFIVTIGPTFHNYNRESFEMTMLGCLEKIEAM